MWKRSKSKEDDMNRIPNSIVVAIVLALVALAGSLGVARWSWLLLDEQTDLRREFNELDVRQAQVEVQYEFWLGQLQDDMDALN